MAESEGRGMFKLVNSAPKWLYKVCKTNIWSQRSEKWFLLGWRAVIGQRGYEATFWDNGKFCDPGWWSHGGEVGSYKVKSHPALHERSVHVTTCNLYLNKNYFKTSKPTTLCPLKLSFLTSNLHYILLAFYHLGPLQSCYGSLSKNYLLVLPSITK